MISRCTVRMCKTNKHKPVYLPVLGSRRVPNAVSLGHPSTVAPWGVNLLPVKAWSWLFLSFIYLTEKLIHLIFIYSKSPSSDRFAYNLSVWWLLNSDFKIRKWKQSRDSFRLCCVIVMDELRRNTYIGHDSLCVSWDLKARSPDCEAWVFEPLTLMYQSMYDYNYHRRRL